MILVEMLVIFLGILLLYGLFRLARALIPELDHWWKKANDVDEEEIALYELAEDESDTAKKAAKAKALNRKKYKSNRDVIDNTLNERRPS